jgi:pimeloyl-ACP methyl ester carboxylesterase
LEFQEDPSVDTPQTHYAKTVDGVHIAYQVFGEGPIDLLYVSGWISNVDLNWTSPDYARFLRRLASFSRLIIFDKRGVGLSDRVPDKELPDLETRMDDLVAVMDAAGSRRAMIFGESDGGPLCAVFAATYPDRVLGLVMHGPDVRAAWAPDSPWGMTPEDFRDEVENIERGWGTGRFERGFLEEMAPSMVGDEDFLNWTTTYFRQSASPGAAVALNRMWYAIDIREVISAVAVPTLILNRTSAILNPVEETRYLAERMPAAEYIELPGADHLPWVGDQDALFEHVERFVSSTRDEEAELDRVLATVLFTDIGGSTETAAQLGDRAWAEAVERHHSIVRSLLARHRGREVDTAGDGFFATFDGPARGVRCAQQILKAVQALGMQIRAGVHTGEVRTINEKVGGLGVVIGSRVGAMAGPGEILVSRTVKDLTAGSGLVFEDVGEHELKGVPDRWHLYRVVE